MQVGGVARGDNVMCMSFFPADLPPTPGQYLSPKFFPLLKLDEVFVAGDLMPRLAGFSAAVDSMQKTQWMMVSLGACFGDDQPMGV